jgi:protein phosphatase 1B
MNWNASHIDCEIQRQVIGFDQQLRPNFPATNSQVCFVNDGTTFIAALFLPNGTLKLVNLGDSRAIAIKIDGSCIRRCCTMDHKPDNENEVARIQNARGSVHEGRVFDDLAVSRTLGDFRLKLQSSKESLADGTDVLNYPVSNIPDIITFSADELADTRYLVLACDGVWDVMSNEDVGAFVCTEFAKPGATPESVSQALILEASRRGSGDNISAIVIDLGPPENRFSWGRPTAR